MARKKSIIPFLFLFCADWAASKEVHRTPLCTHLFLRDKIEPPLTEIEKRLVCGDPLRKGRIFNEGWQEIPHSQARYNLENFLQERGYLHPSFFALPRLNQFPESDLEVDIGTKTRVSRVIVEDPEDLIQVEKNRTWIGETLTPQLLSNLERWIAVRLQTQGYPCPRVSSLSNPDTGEIKVHVEPGALYSFGRIHQERIPETVDNLLRRYDAFQSVDPFNIQELSLTEDRIAAVGLVESSHFGLSCMPQSFQLRQSVLPGAPRLWILGLGADTEGLVRAKILWKNTRVGLYANRFEISAYGTARNQYFGSSMNAYFLPRVSRVFFNPRIQSGHRNEPQFEELSTLGQAGLSTTYDKKGLGATFSAALTLEYFKTLKGLGLPESHFTSLESRVGFKSHSFEFFASDPREGFDFSLQSNFSLKGLFSKSTAQRLNFKANFLWNFKGYDPPLWIFGVRVGFRTVITDAMTLESRLLPASFYQYLGGSADIRGFGRQELPHVNSQTSRLAAAVTASSLSGEARLSHVLPFGLDPFFFLDVGGLGARPLSLDPLMFWSPGLGLRWASPVGIVRTTLAQGYENWKPSHFQFFFSFGEEF